MRSYINLGMQWSTCEDDINYVFVFLGLSGLLRDEGTF